MALANLPAYMVNKVKAYQRTPEDAYLTRPDSAQKRADDPWVLDVALKRQYAMGWIANAEVGYGTDDRSLARLFALRFTDHSHLAAYASANNLNRMGSPSVDSGSWDEENAANGLFTRRQGGIDFRLSPKGTNSRFSTSLTASRTTTNLQTYTAATSFLPDGDSYSQSRSGSENKSTYVKWSGGAMKSHKLYYLVVNLLATYDHSTYGGEEQQAVWAVNPIERYRGASLDSCFSNLSELSTFSALTKSRASERRALRLEETQRLSRAQPTWGAANTVMSRTQSKSNEWMLYGYTNFSLNVHKLKRTVQIMLDGRYETSKADEASHYLLSTYAPTASTDPRNRYNHLPKRHYNFSAYMGLPLFSVSRSKMGNSLIVSYDYKQSYDSDSRNLYRLDLLGGWWVDMDNTPLGALPSTTDSLTLATDWANTSATTQHSRTHTGKLRWYYYNQSNRLQVNASLAVLWGRDRISDFRGENHINRNHSRHTFSMQPSLSVNYRNLQFWTSAERRYPSQLLLLDVRDDTNPLAVYLGAADLKPTDYYYANVTWRGTKTSVQRNWSLTLHYAQTVNAVGQTREYVRSTGGYIYTPRNINGNLNGNVAFNFSQAIDKQKHWLFSSDTKLSYLRSADFALDDATEDEASKSIVHNLGYVQSLGLDYRRGLFHASIKVSADYGHATSSRPSFETINTVDMLYRLTLHTPLFWGIVADTDLNLFARAGYNDASMNTSEWVWNASLSRTLDRRKSLTLKLSAHDILDQMSSVRRAINAQGRTETWTNTLTRYFMLHLTYRFSKKPKQHGDE